MNVNQTEYKSLDNKVISLILDATCSALRKWPVEADVRIDVRPETKPDIIADDRFLPFRAKVFESIYCDPPHILYAGKNTWAKGIGGVMVQRFGYWKTRGDWHDYLDKTNVEFARVLTSRGTLYYKILDGRGGGSTRLKDLERLTNFKIILDIDEPSKGVSRLSKIHYVTMISV